VISQASLEPMQQGEKSENLQKVLHQDVSGHWTYGILQARSKVVIKWHTADHLH